MNHNERFGALRAPLQGPPTPKRWAQVCRIVRGFAPKAFEDQVEPYAQEMLKHWPVHLRVTPRSWAKALIRGKGFPAIRLCRHLDLSKFILHTDEMVMLLRSQRYMQDLRVLNLRGAHIDVDELRLLYKHPALQQVEHLNAEFSCYRFTRGGPQSFMQAIQAQHELMIGLPLKSLLVEDTSGLNTYLSSQAAQQLTYLKVGQWEQEHSDHLSRAFDGVEGLHLEHLVVHLKNTSERHSDAYMERLMKLFSERVRASESVWIDAPMRHYCHAFAAQSWEHTKDLIFVQEPHDTFAPPPPIDTFKVLDQRSPSLRLHHVKRLRDDSLHGIEQTLHTLRLTHGEEL